MSVICRTFVQNAWRSDLCSNCFKSFDDHSDGTARRNNVCEKLAMPRYVPQAPSLYQSRGISTSLKWRLNESLYDRVARRDFASQTPANSKMSTVTADPRQMEEEEDETQSAINRGILIKNDPADKKIRSRPNVDFAVEEALVIGYGGNDYDSDTSPWEMGSDDGSIDLDLLDDTDEDRKITRMTKNNTEFNSFNKNLLSDRGSPPERAKKEEKKLNSINNNINNPSKATDKTINILTFNDIQSTKAEKKLNHYFFPSPTDAIKSYLNGHSNSLVIEEPMIKNNNERSLVTNNMKILNFNRETEKKENGRVILQDEFTPLNTRTYSFVSELNKNNMSFEHSSDSDYSTCRHTTGDSTDSESFHDAEESRRLPKSSFLHGTYTMASPRVNESDAEKKYDAGSSTSGDISNFSDDSDTHECTDGTSYKPQNVNPTMLSTTENKELGKNDKHNVQLILQTEYSIADSNNQRSVEIAHSEKQSPKNSKHKNASAIITDNEKSCKSQNEINERKSNNGETVSSVSKNSPNARKDKGTSNAITKSRTETDSSPQKIEISKNSVPNNSKPSKHTVTLDSEANITSKGITDISASNPSSVYQDQRFNISDSRKEDNHCNKVSGDNLNGNESPKENILRDKEFGDYEDNSDNDKSPEAINNRQSKLAALALELEMARRDSEIKSGNMRVPSQQPLSLPEVKVRYSLPNPPSNSTPENYSTIKKTSAISCASRLSTLPDVLQETPAKQKKSKFSLKKLLKRNKDSGTFSPANKEVNPKAWKKQTFDRNRLSLEIVHPMDLTSDVPTSADSTPTEEHKQIISTNPGRMLFKGVGSRARSLSALPQLSGDDQSGCALLECRKMDTVPARKAGTVAERKKNRPSLVRTPSCSALPNRSSSTTISNNDRTPPPKPPPPPKCKAMHPPPPPPPPYHHPRPTKPSTNSPARPPPPKVPEPKSRTLCNGSSAQELHEQNHSDKEYANLGDIRSLMTPKKPQRPSAFSANPRDSEMDPTKSTDDIYETLPATVEEEEDHYTYLDEAEVKIRRKNADEAEVKETDQSSKMKSIPEPIPCGRPWLDLQTSYTAIAAANYESLAELITTSLNEGVEYFKKLEPSLKWRDFLLHSAEQFHIIKDKAVYNAVHRNESQDKVTLVVAPRKYTSPQNARSQTRFPVLASFIDHIPKNFVDKDNYILQESETASIYVLQQSNITTVSDFAKNSSTDNANQYIHLRNYCFVLLQLIHTLKSLQAEGIEEINYDLQILILVVTDEDKPPILVLFPEDKTHLTASDLSFSRKTLCQATLETMLHFLQIHTIEDLKECIVNGENLADPVAHTFRAIAKVLSEEKASSLSQAKGLLEYMLWGPVDVKVSQNNTEDILETILQRWLDLQRAQMVKSTISHLQSKKNSHIALHVYEEYQLIFLLQASVKSLKNVISKL